MVFLRASLIAVAITTIVASATASSTPHRSLSGDNCNITNSGAEAAIAATSRLFSYCGADIVGGDTWVERYPSPDDCVANCLPSTGCNAGTWTTNGGTCYFKRLRGGSGPQITVVPKEGAVSFMREDEDTPFHVPYLMVDFDIPGNDYASVHADSGSSCPGLCYSDKRCNAFTWSPYYPGSIAGTCWLKTKPSAYAPSPKAVSGIASKEQNAAACLAYV